MFFWNQFVNDEAFVRPLIYSHFSGGISDGQYAPVSSMNKLQKTIEDALASFNETNPPMNLVLFEDALIHVARINRILESPQGICSCKGDYPTEEVGAF